MLCEPMDTRVLYQPALFLIFYIPHEAVSLLRNHLQATLMGSGECSLSWNYKNEIMQGNRCYYVIRLCVSLRGEPTNVL